MRHTVGITRATLLPVNQCEWMDIDRFLLFRSYHSSLNGLPETSDKGVRL